MIKVAVIGCGQWGPNHLRNFRGLRGASAVAAADVDAQRLARMGEMFPGLRLERDHRRILKDRGVDAVVISTPTATHHKLVREALRAGKHVLCEKPLCETAAQARELVALAKARRRVLMVGHVFLFNAGILKVKEILDAGELGDLHYLSAVRVNLGPIRSDVNAAYDLATHDVSIFNWLLGREPEVVSATGGSFLQRGIEDVAFISLKYPGNVVANIHASWLNPKKMRQMTVVGSRRMVTWDDLELEAPVAIYDKGANAIQEYTDYGGFLRISMWDGEVRLPKVYPEEPLRAQDRAFAEAIERGRLERSDGAFAAGVVRVLEAVRASLKRGGGPVRVRR